MAKKRILLIDDEVGLTKLLQLNLEQTGAYEVRVVNQGAQAFEAAQEFQPDLILCDIIMPDMEGTEVAAQVKADSALSRVPFIFLTAVVSREEVEAQGGMIGGHEFIAKPVAMDKVIECIEKHLRS